MQTHPTPCAFHSHQFISHFCQSLSCLLPLCPHCISIHEQEHSNLDFQMEIVKIQGKVRQTKEEVKGEMGRLDSFYEQAMNKFQKSQTEHKRMAEQVAEEQNALIQTINKAFNNIFQQLNENSRKREQWVKDFYSTFKHIKSQYYDIQNTLDSDKYLRIVIMWKKLQPTTYLNHMLDKISLQWEVPSFQSCNKDKITKVLAKSMKLQILQIEGDTGIHKLTKILKILRYGQEPKKGKKLLLTKI